MGIIWFLFHAGIFVVSLPFQALVAALVFADSGWPVVFRQKRIGRNGRPFVMYKYRTMVPGAHDDQKRLARLNEADGPVFKIHDDPRFTRIGKLLSHTGLDELPQLWNVLVGDMSLVGPRPLPVAEAAKIPPRYRSRELVAPGIISPWVINGYHQRTFREWMESDVRYARTKSAWGDAVLVVKAIPFVVSLCRAEIDRRGSGRMQLSYERLDRGK